MASYSLYSVTVTYEEVKRLVTHVAHKFYAKHGGDWGEVFSAANEAFMDAYLSYDPKRSRLTTWVTFKVNMALLGHLKGRIEGHKKERKAEDYDLNSLPDARREFSLKDFAEGLSDDARTVVALVFESPKEVFLSHAGVERGRGTPPRRLEALTALLGELGWSAARALESFKEVAEALSD